MLQTWFWRRGLACLLLLSFGMWPSYATLSQDASATGIALQLVPVHQNQVHIEVEENSVVNIQTLGNDPYVEFDLVAGVPAELDRETAFPPRNVLAFEYFSSTGIGGIELRLRDRGNWQPPLDAGGLLAAQTWTAAGLTLVAPENDFWTSGRARRLRIDFGQAPEHSLSLRGAQLRALTEDELAAEKAAEAAWNQKLATAKQWEVYLDETTPQCIERVRVDNDQIVIEGTLPAADGQPLWLVELEPQLSSAIAGPRRVLAELSPDSTRAADGRFEFRQPRWLEGYDRLLSRWQVAQQTGDGLYRPVSTAVYASDLAMSRPRALPAPPLLRNAKGLGGVSPVFGLEELVELGVKHITVNVVITDLLEAQEIPGGETFDYAGMRWWVRKGRLAHVDQSVTFATENRMVVAAIILLPQRSSDGIVHPESTSSGIYAMPNLVDRQAALKYVACMRFLAERYSGGQFGRIDHWIMHNEVDFGWIWTNMGQQPLPLLMDHYVRSMRIAALQTRSFNPHAQVFISLTHHWNVDDDPRGRTYSPRRMLDWLARATKAEGEFPWGVAYHPYPENLFDPRTWDDPNATDDDQTRLITMKNLQVVKRYLQQPQLLDSAGQQRSVLLSEQGYHTADYSQAAQELQAQAIHYTWKRLRETDFVMAYDYHRWVDAREEGGLLLGLRTVGGPNNIAGEKKLGWTAYRDIDPGTAQTSTKE